MTRLGVTFGEVAKIANIILASGENPTIEKIRRELGTGSNSTIAKYLNEWRADRLMSTSERTPEAGLPPDSVHAAVNHVWEKIRAESEAKIKATQEKASREIEIAEAERNQVIIERDQLQQDLDNHQKWLNQVSADKEILVLDLKALQQEHLLLQEKYKNLESELKSFKQASDNQITLLKSIYERESTDKSAIISNIQQSHEATLSNLIESHENNRHLYMVEADSFKVEKQQFNKIIEKLSNENQIVKSELAESNVVIKMLSSELESVKHESNKKDRMIENNDSFLQSIRDEIRKQGITEFKNDILLKIEKLDKKFNNNDEILLSVFNLLAKPQELIEEKQE